MRGNPAQRAGCPSFKGVPFIFLRSFMRQSEIELLMAYIVNEESRLENDVIELTNRVRFRRVDITDCVELIVAINRLDNFREFALIVIRLLRLGE